ncbi:MAG: CAAX prenyl protease-related protein [Bryobacteraceae bacterium]
MFLGFLFLLPRLPLSPAARGPIWVLCLAPLCVACWPRRISARPIRPLWSIAIGAAVFLIWIGPDLLFHGYRDLPLFSNFLVGHAHSSIPAVSLHSTWVLGWRTARAVIIVPVVEELFWRAWLMRWLIDAKFERVPLGTFAPFAFWATAVLFASEHGPYWDVGLITGVIYNAWMVRSKSVADCVLMHAVTNGLLSAYIMSTAQWQYWM